MDRDDCDQGRQREDGDGGDGVEPELLREGLPPGLLLGQAGHDRQVDQVVGDPGQGNQTEVAGLNEVGASGSRCAEGQDRPRGDDSQGVVADIEEQLPRDLAGEEFADERGCRHQRQGRPGPPQVEGREHEGLRDGDRVTLEPAHHDGAQLGDDHQHGHHHQRCDLALCAELAHDAGKVGQGDQCDGASADRAHDPGGQEDSRMPRVRHARPHPGHPALLSESNRSMAHGNGSCAPTQHVGHIITHSGALTSHATTFLIVNMAGHEAFLRSEPPITRHFAGQ